MLSAVGSGQAQALPDKLRLTLLLSGVVGFAGVVGLVVLSGTILQLFGAGYAQEATLILQLLSLGVFAIAIKDHYVAIYRSQDRVGSIIVPITCGALIEILAPVFGALQWGLLGFTAGWLVGLYIQALLMAPRVFKAMRREASPTTEMQP